MGISMRKKRDKKDIVKIILVYVLALGIAAALAVFLPLPDPVKKLLFFILLIVFAFIGVFLLTKRK